MKRRTLAIILLCIGIVGLLLPWRYTLYSGEEYSIMHNLQGGNLLIHNFEEVRSMSSPSSEFAGAFGKSMEELIEKVLSGNMSGMETYFIARWTGWKSAEITTSMGMNHLYVPRLPEGYATCGYISWYADGIRFNVREEETKDWLGQIDLHMPGNCYSCKVRDEEFAKYENTDSADERYYRLSNGAKAVARVGKNKVEVSLWGKSNGAGYHASLYIDGIENVTEQFLSSFGAKRYFSTHPKMLMIYAIDIGHGLGAIATLAGIDLLVYPLLKKKMKHTE